MSYLRPLGPEAGTKALASPDILSMILDTGKGNTQETKTIGDKQYRLTYDRRGNVVNQTEIGPAAPTQPKSVGERVGGHQEARKFEPAGRAPWFRRTPSRADAWPQRRGVDSSRPRW